MQSITRVVHFMPKVENGKNAYLHIKYSDDGGKTFTPGIGDVEPGDTPGRWLGQYTDEYPRPSMDVKRYTWQKIRGEDGITIAVRPEVGVLKKKNEKQILTFKVDLYAGETKIPYGENIGYTCSSLHNTQEIMPGVKWGFTVDQQDFNFGYVLSVAANVTDVDLTLPFVVTFNGKEYSRSVRLMVLKDGEKGSRGAILRGPQSWADMPVGYIFEAGGEGDKYLDIVEYKGNYYLCNVTHVRGVDNAPLSAVAEREKYWVKSDKTEMVATKVLLANYALVKNLGAEAIEMPGFTAKDGAVTCTTGTFENVNVKGTIKGEDGYFAGFVKRTMKVIGPTGIEEYTKKKNVDEQGHVFRDIDFEKLGGLMKITGQWDVSGGMVMMPGFDTADTSATHGMNIALSYLGSTLVILNKGTNLTPNLGGYVTKSETLDNYGSVMLRENHVYVLECKMLKHNRHYGIYWLCKEFNIYDI